MTRVVMVLIAVICACAARTGQAQSARDPKAILSQANAALSEAKTLRFSAEARGWGALAVSEPLVRGPVVIDHFELGKPVGWRLRVVGARATEDPMRSGRFEVNTTEDEVLIFDHSEREVIGGRRPDLAGMLEIAGRELLWWVLEWKESVGPVLQGKQGVSATWDGQRSVGGEYCDVVHVDASGLDDAATDTWWFISVTDHLPRRVDRLVQTDRGPGMLSLEITSLKAEPEIDPGYFSFTYPPGPPAKAGDPLPAVYAVRAFKPEATPPRYRWRGRPSLAAGALAPDFQLLTMTGQERKLSDLRGRVVVLAFWASWSKPSVEMLRKLGEASAKWESKPLTLWALSSADHGDPVEVFKGLKLGFEMLPSADSVARRMGVQDVPGIVVIGPDGRTLATLLGGGESELKAANEAVAKGLAETGP